MLSKSEQSKIVFAEAERRIIGYDVAMAALREIAGMAPDKLEGKKTALRKLVRAVEVADAAIVINSKPRAPGALYTGQPVKVDDMPGRLKRQQIQGEPGGLGFWLVKFPGKGLPVPVHISKIVPFTPAPGDLY